MTKFWSYYYDFRYNYLIFLMKKDKSIVFL